VIGMPRRYADYLPDEGFTWINQVSSVGAFLLGASLLPFVYNVWRTWRYAPLVTTDDPWGYGASLEWATSCPSPRHNFDSLPRIRSERPAFDLHHPSVTAPDQPRADRGTLVNLLGPPDIGGTDDGFGGSEAGTGATGGGDDRKGPDRVT